MSHEESKVKHSKRIQQKFNHILRQLGIRKAHKFETNRYNDMQEAHRYHKVSGVTCGNSNCVMCGNPRKFWNEKTIQEKRFEQNLRDMDYEPRS